MSPLMQQTLEQKRLRRARLMSLPYPEKVRIVEQMRDAALRIKAVASPRSGATALREAPSPYRTES